MSKTKIPIKDRRELWFRAAGRCEFKGCNEPLDRHGITMDTCDCSECAHIIADSMGHKTKRCLMRSVRFEVKPFDFREL